MPFLVVSNSTVLLDYFFNIHIVYLSHEQFLVHVKRIAILMSYTLPYYQFNRVESSIWPQLENSFNCFCSIWFFVQESNSAIGGIVIKECNHPLILRVWQSRELKKIWIDQSKSLTGMLRVLRETALVATFLKYNHSIYASC